MAIESVANHSYVYEHYICVLMIVEDRIEDRERNNKS